MEGMEALDSVLNAMPGTETTAAPAQETTKETAPTAPTTETATGTEQTQTQPEGTEGSEQKEFEPEEFFTGKKEKQNATFAKMRVENKKYHDTIARLGSILGVDAKDPEALIIGLNNKVLEYQSQQAKVPYELLQDLESTKTKLAEYEKASVREQALLAFQKVKDTYSLTNAQLETFATQLREQGVDPFQAPVDLDREYWIMNREQLVKQIKDKTEQEVLARNAKAAEHSTTPSKAKGSETHTAPVGSMAAFESFMASFPGDKK